MMITCSILWIPAWPPDPKHDPMSSVATAISASSRTSRTTEGVGMGTQSSEATLDESGMDPRGDTQRAARFLRMRPVQGAAAFLVYFGAWLPSLWIPLLTHLYRCFLEWQSSDPSIFVWSLRWWPFAIGHAISPLHTGHIFAPHGTNLAWVTSVPGPALVAAPITLALGPVV